VPPKNRTNKAKRKNCTSYKKGKIKEVTRKGSGVQTALDLPTPRDNGGGTPNLEGKLVLF
jgi:hypothetical protein